ncbi:MAG TPA: cytochrome c biogenesis protein ResB [Opitutaceae bacterium]|nr:cytochrome c biogenesis protein ResB [Opitutaceae bacterium]
MPPFIRQLRNLFVSLRLTVVLLALSIVLVFWATLDQVHLGVWAVQQKFFHSFLVFVRLGDLRVPVYPGGYTIGGLLLVNLISAHAYRFRRGWGKAGIWIAHTGLIMLLVGELVSGLVQQDFQMRLDEGETKNFSESSLLNELAVIDATDPNFDEVVAIPESFVARGTVLQNPRLPFKVVPRGYYENSAVQLRSQAPGAPPSPATQGMGPQLAVTPLEVTYRQDERNTPAAYVELVGPEGSLGTWTVSTLLGNPQAFPYAGRTWKLVMRPKRLYEPYSLTLEKFSHDIYPGTDIPKNFSSRVRINPAGGGEGREVLIYMNNPLRYDGLTYYQASFENNDKTTILQVVRNPSWLVPYIACAAIGLGLVVQFLLHLAAFGRARRPA